MLVVAIVVTLVVLVIVVVAAEVEVVVVVVGAIGAITFSSFKAQLRPARKHSSQPGTTQGVGPRMHIVCPSFSAPRAWRLLSHTTHLTPHTLHLTPHISHLTPQTSHLLKSRLQLSFLDTSPHFGDV